METIVPPEYPSIGCVGKLSGERRLMRCVMRSVETLTRPAQRHQELGRISNQYQFGRIGEEESVIYISSVYLEDIIRRKNST